MIEFMLALVIAGLIAVGFALVHLHSEVSSLRLTVSGLNLDLRRERAKHFRDPHG